MKIDDSVQQKTKTSSNFFEKAFVFHESLMYFITKKFTICSNLHPKKKTKRIIKKLKGQSLPEKTNSRSHRQLQQQSVAEAPPKDRQLNIRSTSSRENQSI